MPRKSTTDQLKEVVESNSASIKSNETNDVAKTSKRKQITSTLKKESDKWIRNLRYGKEIKKINTEGKIVYVCDREADIWDLMSEIQKQKSEFVIRSKTPKSIVRYANSNGITLQPDYSA